MPRQHHRNNPRPPGANRPQEPAMQAINSPYNFVPLSEQVVVPDWAHLVSHDVPFKDGLSGEIAFTLTAHTPILVGGQQTKASQQAPGEVRFFQTPDGYAIPGSSLKGMVRNVLEIITFSRMGMVDDARYSVRDLTNPARGFYGRFMTEKVGENMYRPLSQAGWLSFQGDRWFVTPCAYSRIDHDELAVLSGDRWWRAVPRVCAREKYSRWRPRSLDIRFTPGLQEAHPHSGGKMLVYSKAADVGRGAVEGMLVFTGQPAARVPPAAGKKHLEFVFYDVPTTRQVEVPEAVMRDFMHIHAETDEWAYWKSRARIPIFFLTDLGGTIASLGLALMFKLAYPHSIVETIKHTSSSHAEKRPDDFACLMFGMTDVVDGLTPLKGRVWFEPCTERAGVLELDARRVVLNSPKPTYYPNYVAQPTVDGTTLARDTYKTYMDKDSEIRGWKRYPVRPALTHSSEGTDAVSVNLFPIDGGAQFSGRVVFHNLKPEELGALIWALTWGGDEAMHHSIGMGKPYGYGQASVQIESSHVVSNDPITTPLSLSNCMEKFVSFMEKQVQGWAKSPQMRALRGMADAASARAFRGDLRHMVLAQEDGRNDFVKAKKDRLVLAAYPQRGASGLKTSSPGGTDRWLGVPLVFNKGKREISASKEKERAFVMGAEADSLLASLDPAALKRLQQGRLRADITVEHRGGPNWKIIKIDPKGG